MAPGAFLERGSPPDDAELRDVLGRAVTTWDALHTALASRFAPLGEKWSYAGKAYGWSLQLKQKKRTVLYMIPCRDHFVAAFALSDAACRAARESALPESILETIASAPKYPEGRAVRIEVRSKKDLPHVERLAILKMEN